MANRSYSADDAKRDAKDVAQETASEVREGARKVADQARETLDNVTHSDSVERVKERGAELAGAARDAGREYADRARHEAERLYEEGRQRAGDVANYAEDTYDEVSEMVRRKPAQALGIAVGVGFLVGLILARR
ncbi:DUF883 family protein [Paracoccus tegillarcae]|uniref:DUF883 domain-containing protein n=1 Tax=Paracoccus tegillarcae TaxID=1529068 RepID=A0A2K9EV44_9RHOB|nr:DUF883 family protein [Paracoccus tegillarcae]AUH34756.1 DUF883 domain-containing protein [Paracoccus tegillarcae]